MKGSKICWILSCSLCFVLGSYSNIISKAETDLQSIGRITFTNPDTGQEEVIFDAKDQNKLKDDINANGSEIIGLKEWKEQQLEINQELSDKDLELEQNINELVDELGGFTPIIDETSGEIIGYKTTIGGADTVFPFKSTEDYNIVVQKKGTTYTVDCDSDKAMLISPVQSTSATLNGTKIPMTKHGSYYEGWGTSTSSRFSIRQGDVIKFDHTLTAICYFVLIY